MDAPEPEGLRQLPPGDYCNTEKDDQCATLQSDCINNVCVTKNTKGTDCTHDIDCPVGTFCNYLNDIYICTATVLLGNPCTPGISLTQINKECGYGGYCINSKCVSMFWFENGDLGVKQEEIP